MPPLKTAYREQLNRMNLNIYDFTNPRAGQVQEQ